VFLLMGNRHSIFSRWSSVSDPNPTQHKTPKLPPKKRKIQSFKAPKLKMLHSMVPVLYFTFIVVYFSLNGGFLRSHGFCIYLFL